MYKIQTVTAGSAVASLDFTVPSGYDDLYLVVSARNDSGAGDQLLMSFNGVTTNRSSRRLRGNGSDAASATSSDIFGYLVDTNQTANTFSNASYYISNYAGSTAKSVSVDVVTENNGTAAYQSIVAALWNSTDPITSISLQPNAGNLVQGSTATLYGIRKYNTTATPKATGGIITYDSVNNYWVHTFTASGTFTPTQNLTCEYLVIAGGGGGAQLGGGGGAGGYRSSVSGESSGGGASAESPLSLTASTNYTVTIGAGGAGLPTSGTESGVKSYSGSNTTFSTITATGGGGGGSNISTLGTNGGSGGGSGQSQTTAATGTANQGYNGGTSSTTNNGSGGGGAGSVGGNTPGQYKGGNGGSGVTSSITGTAIARAGGGGGGGDTAAGRPGTAGTATAGGGAGSASNTAAGNGDAFTGGGGGGGGQLTQYSATGAGGSGVVIIRYAA